MVITIRNFIIAYLLFAQTTFFHITLEQFIFSDYLFFIVFIPFFSWRFFDIYKDEKFNFNLDLLYKFFLIFLKLPSFFTNYFTNTQKKIWKFFFRFKHKRSIDSYKIIYHSFTRRFFVTWRPLFKKLSYFGYYRTNRSKWIK